LADAADAQEIGEQDAFPGRDNALFEATSTRMQQLFQ